MTQNVDGKNDENLFTEFYASARDLILDRVSSPFIFSFVIAWLISNYKIVMVILTSQTENFVFDYKIQLIENYLEPFHGLLYPFLGACFYTFLYPFIDQKIAKFTLERKMDIRNDKNEVEKSELRTVEEVKAIHQRHFKIEQEYKVEIENARAIESQLRAQVESLQGEINRRNLITPAVERPQNEVDKLDELIKNMSSTESTILKKIGASHNNNLKYVSFEDISKILKIPRIDFDIAVNELINKKLVFKTSSGNFRLENNGLVAFKKLNT